MEDPNAITIMITVPSGNVEMDVVWWKTKYELLIRYTARTHTKKNTHTIGQRALHLHVTSHCETNKKHFDTKWSQCCVGILVVAINVIDSTFMRCYWSRLKVIGFDFISESLFVRRQSNAFSIFLSMKRTTTNRHDSYYDSTDSWRLTFKFTNECTRTIYRIWSRNIEITDTQRSAAPI